MSGTGAAVWTVGSVRRNGRIETTSMAKEPFKILVCGPRDWRDRELVYRHLDRLTYRPLYVITGAATGADQIALDWAESHDATPIRYPADWKKHGRSAGPKRNQLMLDHERPHRVLAFQPSGRETRGTQDMIRRARAAGVPVEIVEG